MAGDRAGANARGQATAERQKASTPLTNFAGFDWPAFRGAWRRAVEEDRASENARRQLPRRPTHCQRLVRKKPAFFIAVPSTAYKRRVPTRAPSPKSPKLALCVARPPGHSYVSPVRLDTRAAMSEMLWCATRTCSESVAAKCCNLTYAHRCCNRTTTLLVLDLLPLRSP